MANVAVWVHARTGAAYVYMRVACRAAHARRGKVPWDHFSTGYLMLDRRWWSSFPPRAKKRALRHAGRAERRVSAALPLQCCPYGRDLCETEMFVYFATVNLPPDAWSDLAEQLCEEGGRA